LLWLNVRESVPGKRRRQITVMHERWYGGAYKPTVTQTQTSVHSTYNSVNWHYCQYKNVKVK